MTTVAEERRRGSRTRSDARALAVELAARVKGGATPGPVDHGSVEGQRRHRRAWAVFTVLALLLGAYVVSLLVRRPHEQWTWLDGWSVVGFEFVASLTCLARGLTRRPGRAAVLFLGFALLSWSIGDTILTGESLGGATVAVPSAADLFYLLFYPVAYVATVKMLQRGLGRLARPNWLDGVVAGLGAAALCATFAFHRILDLTGGSRLSTAVNLAYPIGDLLLLSLVIGGSVLLVGRWSASWCLLGGGLAVIVFGDTFNIFQSSNLATRLGADVNAAAWPTALLLMSMSVWTAPRLAEPLREERTAGMTMPGLAALASLVILVVGTVRHVSEVAVDLAILTLVAVGVRLAISARRLRVMTEQRHRQANTDELTGLGNRRQLTHVLETFFADEHVTGERLRRLAFLFVDLNHFKEINDSFGHPAGDELLRQLGPRLVRAVGENASVVRLGGDELGVVLLDANEAAAAAVAQRIVDELETPFTLHRINASVGASIGVAMYPGDATEASTLMWCADVAMYRAKLGNTPFVFFDQDLDGDDNQIGLVEDLTRAVHAGAFELHYQPQLDLRTGRVRAVEALLRWPHPELGLIPPLKFISLAEDAGLMGPLTRWVLDEAIGQCAAWRMNQVHVAVSVNVSKSNLLEEGFTELVADLLARHKLPAEQLVIEITESIVFENLEMAQSVIERLRDLGAVVSIDDFGVGFTSLAYLASLAVGELKLDRSFIADLDVAKGGRDLELVRATINLGHEMGLRVVAEGIEDVATLDLLRDLGCDLAQGYYICRPTPADRLSLQAAPREMATPVPVG
ncbi:MAG: putative bifunctional diguanylate cyclase/phosphodiesterase [Acidimicrobiales bacterium]